MAKQMEGFLEGTYDDITFYKMEGKHYARMKSSLTGKTFWKHKSFEGSRRSCSRFGRGNQLASLVYNQIPDPQRKYEIFCKMKSAAIAMIKAGKTEDDVLDGLALLKPIIQEIAKEERDFRVLHKAGKPRTNQARDYCPIIFCRNNTKIHQQGAGNGPDRKKRYRMRERVRRSGGMKNVIKGFVTEKIHAPPMSLTKTLI